MILPFWDSSTGGLTKSLAALDNLRWRVGWLGEGFAPCSMRYTLKARCGRGFQNGTFGWTFAEIYHRHLAPEGSLRGKTLPALYVRRQRGDPEVIASQEEASLVFEANMGKAPRRPEAGYYSTDSGKRIPLSLL